MELRCRTLYKRHGGCYDRNNYWQYNTMVIQLVDFPDIYLEIYSDIRRDIHGRYLFKGYAPIIVDGIPLEYDRWDVDGVRHTIKHDSKVIIKLETNNFGTLYRFPVPDEDITMVYPVRPVSDEEFNRIVEILHPKEVYSGEVQRAKK
jgi:hypothetical protein